jgi:hypothetical protein
VNELPQSQLDGAHALDVGTGRTRLQFTWRWHGEDLHVHVTGGTDHVGAVALAGRQPDGQSFADSLRLPPHREAELAVRSAKALHDALGRVVCVTAGIHLDDITQEEIKDVLATVDEGIHKLVARLKHEIGRRE